MPEFERALDAQYSFHQRNSSTCVNTETGNGHNSDQSTGNNAKSPASQLQQRIPRLTPSPLHMGENNSGEDIEATSVSDTVSLLILVCIPHRQSTNKLHQLNVLGMCSDQALFDGLEATYNLAKGRFIT